MTRNKPSNRTLSRRCLFDAVEPRRLMCSLSHEQMTTSFVPLTPEALALDAQIASSLRSRSGAHADGGSGGGDAAFNIVWTNRGSDGFGMFGSNAATARAVVDAALVKWEAAITDLHQVSGNNRLDLTISMKSSDAGWGGGASGYVYDSAGRPTAGVIEMNRGGDTNGDGVGDGSGWFLDPTPFDNAEFLGNAENAFAPQSSSIGSDFMTVLNSEIIHTLGISADSSSRHNKFPKYSIINSADVSEGGGVGLYAAYQGPSIHHLMSTNNGGPTGSDRDLPLHGAGVKLNGNQGAADAPLFVYANQTWKGAEDASNASFEGGTRYLIPQTILLIMKDSMGYTLAPFNGLDNSYSILNQTTGALTVRGGDIHGSSNDVVDIDIVDGMLRVSVDVSNDVAGTGALSGPGNLPAWVQDFELSEVTSISINTGAGADVVNIRDLYHSTALSISTGTGNDTINVGADGALTGFGSNLTIVADADNDVINVERTSFNGTLNINAGTGNDSIDLADGDFDGDLGGNITLAAGDGVDSLVINDQTDNAGSDTYTFNEPNITRGARSIFYNGTLENLTLWGSANNDVMNVLGFYDDMTVVLRGGNGNDTFNIGVNELDQIMSGGRLELWGDAGADKVIYNDQNDYGSDTYNLAVSDFSKTGWTTVFDPGAMEFVELNASNDDNTINVSGALAGYSVIVRGNAGYDTLNVAPTSHDLDALVGTLVFDGGAHNDTLVLDDSGDLAAAKTYTIGNGTFAKTGTAGMTFGNTEAINLIASNGDSTVLANHNPGSLNVNSGGGNDSITVEANDVVIASGTGVDSLSINPDGVGTASAIVAGTEQLGALSMWLSSTLHLKTGANTVLDVSGGLILSGTLDLNDGRFIRRNPSAGFNPTLNARLKTGWNNGAWNGTGAAIRSDVAAATASAHDAVGYTTAAEANLTTFGGLAVTAGDQLFGYTQYGDTDLDRDVDFDDLLKIAQTYESGSGKFWGHGDFTFDGLVNFDDLLIEAQRYGAAMPSIQASATRSRSGVFASELIA